MNCFFLDYGFTDKLPRTALRAMQPKLMEEKFLANHICLEGFEDISKAEEFKKDFGKEVANTLEAFSMTKVKVVKFDPKNGFAICRMKQFKHLNPKPRRDVKEPSKDLTVVPTKEDVKQTSKLLTEVPTKEDVKKTSKVLTEVPTKEDVKKISKVLTEVPSEIIKQFDYDKTHMETLVLDKPEMVQEVYILATEP